VLPSPQHEKLQQQLQELSTKLNDTTAQLKQSMQHHNMTNAELRRVKEQLNESSTQLADAQQQAQSQAAQIEQQVYCVARLFVSCLHATIDTSNTGDRKRQGAPGCLSR
jgi:regulator of replication initiation timing